MARVRSLEKDDHNSRPHQTVVDCRWQVLSDANGGKLNQLSTYGSDQRPQQKVSQTIQLDESLAEQLAKILFEVFPNIRRSL